MTEINDLYEGMARRRGNWKVGFKVEVWRSRARGQESGVRGRKGQGSGVGSQGSDGMDRKLAEARKEEAEFREWFSDKEGLV